MFKPALSPCAMRRLLRFVVLGALLGALVPATLLAQGIYRSVGAEGRVTYSDMPPPGATGTTPPAMPIKPGAPASPEAELPYALRTVVGRFPVVLYSGTGCVPCNSGRQWLEARGIPFTEKTVNTEQDVQALKRLSGGDALPLLTLGTQAVRGFSATEWGRLMDAAGYPAQSTLSPRYRRPPPVALGEGTSPEGEGRGSAPAPAAARAQGSVVEPPVPVTPPPPGNPAGIRF